METEKRELRLKEEKDRNSKSIASQHEELEARIREETRDKETIIEELQNRVMELEQHNQNMVAQIDHEVSMKQQNIDTLERQLAALKERLSQVEFSKNSTYEKQLENFEQQKSDLNQRLEKYQYENLEKDK